MHASFDPHNIGIVDVVGANPDKLFAFPEQTPSMRWLHKRLPLVPSLDSPSQLLLVSIVRQCCYGRIAPPVSTKPWSEELYTFLETFDTPTHPEGWRGTVARMNDDQLRTKLAELRVDMISNRRAYGSPTSVTPANVAAVATYGHHFQARLRASADKSWFAALTAYR